MPSPNRIRKRVVLVCIGAAFGLGIAAEHYRQYLSTNVGDLSVERTDRKIALAIDGDSFTEWHKPVTLRPGAHQFHATWQTFQLETTIHVKRGDKTPLNRLKYSLLNGQLQVERNLHLIDVAPRPESEVCAIQTASGKFWHSTDGDAITARHPNKRGGADRYTIDWLRPDRSEAFIRSGDGRFVTNVPKPLDTSSGVLRLCDENDWPSVFRIDRVQDSEGWVKFATGVYFVDVDADPKRVQTTRYEPFASPHLLIDAAGESDITKPAPPPPAITVAQAASSTSSVRRFKGHTNAIRAVVFTPDGRHVISASSDGTIRFWDVQSGKQVDTIQTHRPAMSLAISNDGNSLVCGMVDAVVKIWKLDHDPEIAHFDERILSRDYRGDVLSIAFSPDGTKVAAGGRQQHTRIWNLLAPDERCKSSTINGTVTSLVWSRSGERVLICEQDAGSLRWWPNPDGGSVYRPYDARSGKLLIQSGGAPLVVVGGEVLDAETGELVHTVPQRSDLRTISAQLLDSKNLLVTADVIGIPIYELEPDEFVTAWNLETGRPVAVLRDHAGQSGNIAISPTGEFVAYGNGIDDTTSPNSPKPTGDYDLRVWRIANNDP